MFNAIAPGYDRFNHISSLGIDNIWRWRAVRQITDTDKSLKILDLATGTGDFAIAIARKCHGAGSVITGADISEGMLEVGKQKIRRSGLTTPINLTVADAAALPFPDGSYDRISVAFGVRNFEDIPKGLSEMRRVLKNDGKLVILELSYPDNQFILSLYKIYAFKIMPFIGKIITGNQSAFNYLPDSIMKFPKPAKFIPMLRQAGFNNVKCSSFSMGICRMYVAQP